MIQEAGSYLVQSLVSVPSFELGTKLGFNEFMTWSDQVPSWCLFYEYQGKSYKLKASMTQIAVQKLGAKN